MNSDESRFHDLLNEPPFDDSFGKEHHEQLRQRVLEAFDAAQVSRSRPSVRRTFLNWKQIMSRRAPRFAAAALVMAAACVAFIVMFQAKSPVAFASLIDPILKAKTARFNAVLEGKDVPKTAFRTLILEPSRVRQEFPDGQIQIMDMSAGRMLTLKPAEKTATLLILTDLPKEQKPANFFDQLKKGLGAAENDASSKKEPLGQKQIAGHEAIGFRVTNSIAESTIWGDAKTGLPIVVELKLPLMPDAKFTMTDFEFDVELDEALFKTEAPDGYSLDRHDVSTPGEKNLIVTLKLLIDHNEGRFPDTFDMAAILACLTDWTQKNLREPNADIKKKGADFSFSLMPGFTFALTLPAESNVRYAGKGVKYNDATIAVFWYKPAGALNYRVIYGDFSVKEQKAAPESPNAVPVKAGSFGMDMMREMKDKIMKDPPPAPVEPPRPPKEIPSVAPLPPAKQSRVEIRHTSRSAFRSGGNSQIQIAVTSSAPPPPKATAPTGPRNRAVRPLSNSPSSFEAPMNSVDTAETLPRIRSGVAICTRL
jgi:outer membrane lipoprotein-sorting protein